MNILGVETSCDETAIAVVEDGRLVRSNVVASQAEIHSKYGGIVPEIASRQHLLAIVPVLTQAIQEANIEPCELDAVAVTHGPGLAGSLLVGVNAAKGFAFANRLPVIGVNHLEGHIYATWLDNMDPEIRPGFPVVCLIASGGHTDLILMNGHQDFTLIGRTRDDAAGEAFDKASRVLGLGFPGGPAIQKWAENGETGKFRFPRPRVKNSMDYSFSGLKTAVVRKAEELGLSYGSLRSTSDSKDVSDFARSFQEAIVDCLVGRVLEAVALHKARGVILGGGVAANSHLRKEMNKRSPVEVLVPAPVLCTDNGAMIAAAAYFNQLSGVRSEWSMDVVPNLRLG